MAHTGQAYHVTLTLEVVALAMTSKGQGLPLMRVYVMHPHTNFEVLRPYRSEELVGL